MRIISGVFVLATTFVVFAGVSFAGEERGPGARGRQGKCRHSALEASACMIRTAMDDILATYPHSGGGGIAEIRLLSTDTYLFSISQEERVDQLTYELRVGADGRVRILSRKVGVKHQGK